ncbi:Exostosin-like 2 [Liparis tanakae]|uniref:Exostosin-like 2 n=1 Tax=Liparis tanakae TaxID=230148 RepID=A0A4Z2FHG0_9TELE|nr:Exostosin-like 2 [Liparis tanakae]
MDGTAADETDPPDQRWRRRTLCGSNCVKPPRCLAGLRRAYLLWPILLLLLVGAALTALLPPAEAQGGREGQGALRRAASRKESPARGRAEEEEEEEEEEQRFTIVIQTFNRTDILLKLLNHYQAVPHLHQIIIVWNNIGEQTPLKLWRSLQPHPQFSDQIVGFVPRKHVSTPGGVYSYGSFELQDPDTAGGDRYSMVLIGAAFFHRRYLQLFQDQPGAVHALVDETQNCDDIAVNFAVALYLRERSAGGVKKPSGVFVKPVDLRNLEKEASSGYQGMWHRPEHLLQRSYCLNRLAQIYGVMPLRFSNLMLSQFGFPSYANHKSRA